MSVYVQDLLEADEEIREARDPKVRKLTENEGGARGGAGTGGAASGGSGGR